MTVTTDQIRQAMKVLAHIIETHPNGEKAWPIFERLEQEALLREDRAARLKAARDYAPF